LQVLTRLAACGHCLLLVCAMTLDSTLLLSDALLLPQVLTRFVAVGHCLLLFCTVKLDLTFLFSDASTVAGADSLSGCWPPRAAVLHHDACA
jgi:hypothetical protein